MIPDARWAICTLSAVKRVLGLAILLVSLTGSSFAQQPTLPKGTNLTSLVTIDLNSLSNGAVQLMTATLQGLVARKSSAQIYVDDVSDYSLWESHLNSAYGIPTNHVTNPYALLTQFKGLINGYIRCNIVTNTNSIEAATSLCGPLNGIAVDASIEGIVKSYGVTNLLADVSAADDQFVWTNATPDYQSLFSRDVVIEQVQGIIPNLRDYAAMANAYTFYEGNDSFRNSVMAAMNPNAACLGWGDASLGENVFVGDDSSNGVVTIAANWSLDLSTLSSVRDTTLHQRTYDIPSPETNVNYITFIMTDGDNVQEDEGDSGLYNSGYRGQFNFGWALSPSLADLAPSLLRWYYDNASNGPNRDFFVSGVSGRGYFYPSMMPPEALTLQIQQLNDLMTRADMDMVQILDFSAFTNAALWNQYLAQPAINAIVYLDYTRYDLEGGAMYFSTNGKPVLSASDMIWGGLESPLQVATNANKAPRDPSDPASYKLVQYHVYDSTYPTLGSVLQAITNLSNYVQVVTPEEFQKLVVMNIGRNLTYNFTSNAQGWVGHTNGGSSDKAYWSIRTGNPPGDLTLTGSHFGVASTNMDSWYTRQVILPQNAQTLSFDTAAANDGLLQVEVQAPDGTMTTLLPWSGLPVTNIWYTFTAGISNFAGETVTLYFEQMDGGQGKNEYRYFDNVQVLCNGAPGWLPFAPTLFGPTAVSGVNLLWRDNDQNETSFELERSTGSTNGWTQLAMLPAGSTNYTDAGVSPGETYFYRVRSWNAQGASAYSTVQSITVPPFLTFNGLGGGWSLNGTSEGGFNLLNTLELTDGQTNEVRSSFFQNPLYAGAFQASFTYTDASTGGVGANGICFVLQNDPRGAAAIGGGGNSLGYSGITPSVSLQFNINAFNLMGGIGIGFGRNGAIANVTGTSPVAINSGDPINVTFTYLNGTVTVRLQDAANSNTFTIQTNINIPALLGSNMVYVGFTGSDSLSTSTQTVANFQYVTLADLKAQSSGPNVMLSWTASSSYRLQSTASLASPEWADVTNCATLTNNSDYQVILTPSERQQFYRLQLR